VSQELCLFGTNITTLGGVMKKLDHRLRTYATKAVEKSKEVLALGVFDLKAP
jgi:hypothetical protein